MDYKDIRILKMLEAIENDGQTSQRALAENLNISLGLANTCFRRLAAAGYFKRTSNNTGSVKYKLTGKGSREKARLTYEYALLSYSLFKDAQDKLTGFFTELETSRVRRLVFWGVNDFAEIAYLSMQNTSLEMVAVVDDGKIGQRFFGILIDGITVLETLSFDKLLVTDPKIDCDSFSGVIFPEKLVKRVISAPFYSL